NQLRVVVRQSRGDGAVGEREVGGELEVHRVGAGRQHARGHGHAGRRRSRRPHEVPVYAGGAVAHAVAAPHVHVEEGGAGGEAHRQWRRDGQRHRRRGRGRDGERRRIGHRRQRVGGGRGRRQLLADLAVHVGAVTGGFG